MSNTFGSSPLRYANNSFWVLFIVGKHSLFAKCYLNVEMDHSIFKGLPLPANLILKWQICYSATVLQALESNGMSFLPFSPKCVYSLLLFYLKSYKKKIMCWGTLLRSKTITLNFSSNLQYFKCSHLFSYMLEVLLMFSLWWE